MAHDYFANIFNLIYYLQNARAAFAAPVFKIYVYGASHRSPKAEVSL